MLKTATHTRAYLTLQRCSMYWLVLVLIHVHPAPTNWNLYFFSIMSIYCAFKVTSYIKEGLEESLHLAVVPNCEGQ